MFAPLTSRVRRAAADFGDSRGIAAVEFAFIAPIALGLLSLAVSGGQSLTAYHKVVLAAHSVTDLVSRTTYVQDPSTSNSELLKQSDLDASLALSQMVLYPQSAANLVVVLSELQLDTTTNKGTVVWSEACAGVSDTSMTCNNATYKLQVGATFQLDSSYSQAGATYLLYGQVYYQFQPLGGLFNLSPMTLSSTEVLTIRNARQITVQWGS
jgi:Flp pilus assembly protein TadG